MEGMAVLRAAQCLSITTLFFSPFWPMSTSPKHVKGMSEGLEMNMEICGGGWSLTPQHRCGGHSSITLHFMAFNIHLFKCLWLRVYQTLTCNHPGYFAKRNFCEPNFSFNLSVPIQGNRHIEQESCENCIYKLTYTLTDLLFSTVLFWSLSM